MRIQPPLYKLWQVRSLFLHSINKVSSKYWQMFERDLVERDHKRVIISSFNILGNVGKELNQLISLMNNEDAEEDQSKK